MTTSVQISVPANASWRVKVQAIDPVTLQHVAMVKFVEPGQTITEHIWDIKGLILAEEPLDQSSGNLFPS